MPWWKCAQSPTGGSQPNPVQPNGWVTIPGIGQRSVPLYAEGMLPCAYCWLISSVILAARARFASAVAAIALARFFLLATNLA